jgi:hypothetical protein
MAVFQPELIELMKVVLDDAAATLPEAKRTSMMKAEIASHILAYAAKGERDPTALKIAAPSARRGVYSLFARYLSGAQGSLRHKKKPPGHDSVRLSYATAGFPVPPLSHDNRRTVQRFRCRKKKPAGREPARFCDRKSKLLRPCDSAISL